MVRIIQASHRCAEQFTLYSKLCKSNQSIYSSQLWNDLSVAAANTQFVVSVKSTANKTGSGLTPRHHSPVVAHGNEMDLLFNILDWLQLYCRHHIATRFKRHVTLQWNANLKGVRLIHNRNDSGTRINAC